MKVGLFFGSFNPIHIGHLIIAQTMLESTDMDEIWFIVSPQNPLKKSKSLLHEFDRFDMVEAAVSENSKFRATDIEFHMPRPSYTVDTLTLLSEKNPDKSFKLIIGEDNLTTFKKWKNHHIILNEYGLLVYPRPNSSADRNVDQEHVQFVDAPLLDISATFIRNNVRNGKSIHYLVPETVENLIKSKGYYL